MKQQEKTQRTRERILAAAVVEFGTKSYEAASINAICARSGVPKGLLYYHFPSKDALYLYCAKTCYSQMTQYLKARRIDAQDVQGSLEKLLEIRQTFFAEHPDYANIFFHTVLQPPRHLLEELRAIREEFNTFYTQCYRGMLEHLSLREGITLDMALEYFSIFTDAFNQYFQGKAREEADYGQLIADHEGKLSVMLDIMLYGIVQDKTQESR